MSGIGETNTLRVVKRVDHGVYLDGHDLGEILLPRRYVPEDCSIGDSLEVFIYLDSEDILIATTEKPHAEVGQFARLKVVSVNSFGAFLDWGLPKDLLVPFREQKKKMDEGRSYVVFIYVDDRTSRIVASSKLDKFLGAHPSHFRQGQEVSLFVCETTDMGYKAIIDNTHWGMLYKNEVFGQLEEGSRVKGFINKIRDDGKIDLCLHKPGYEKIDGVAQKILDELRHQGGFIPVTDSSSPEIIYELFGISKKMFKKAVGALYKKRAVIIEAGGIKLA